MNAEKIKNAYNCFCGVAKQWFNMMGNNFKITNDCVGINNCLTSISQDIQKEYPSIGKEILILKDNLFMVSGVVNPVVLGEIISLLKILRDSQGNDDFWDMVHPIIVNTSKKLFEDGHYANSSEDAYIEINSRVKKLFKIINPNIDKVPDGDAAMNAMFSPKNPMIRFADVLTDTGYNIQQGYMQLFKGAISAFRNPKAHENISLECEECKKRLIFASMLMCILDEGVKYTGISEK